MTDFDDSYFEKKQSRMTTDDWDPTEPSPDGIFLLDPKTLCVIKSNTTFLNQVPVKVRTQGSFRPESERERGRRREFEENF